MFYQNNQIHNSLYLTVGNSNEIGKVYQVMGKWVFFKLLFANLTDSSRGKNHTTFKTNVQLSNERKRSKHTIQKSTKR